MNKNYEIFLQTTWASTLFNKTQLYKYRCELNDGLPSFYKYIKACYILQDKKDKDYVVFKNDKINILWGNDNGRI